MKKLLAVSALLLSTSVFANQFDGTYRTFDCVKYGRYFYKIEMTLKSGDLSHFGTIKESVLKYKKDTCDAYDLIDRKTSNFEYINLFPTSKGFFNIDVKVNGRVVYDIIDKYRYHGVPHIFFGQGGPAKRERNRPTRIDENRRFGDVSFDN